MKRLLIVALFLALPGCVSEGDLFHQSEPAKPEPLTNQQVVPEVVPEVAPKGTPLSPAARAAAPSGGKVTVASHWIALPKAARSIARAK